MKEKLKPGKNNKEERINFVIYWANKIKQMSDEEWSKEQNILINNQLKSFQLTPKQYLEMKKK